MFLALGDKETCLLGQRYQSLFRHRFIQFSQMTFMMLPLVRRFRSRTVSLQDLPHYAAKVVVLAPEETSERPAALSLPGQFDRVRDVQPATTPDYERARLTRGEVRHVPTCAFLLRNVSYLNGTVHAGSMRLPQVQESPLKSRQPTQHLPLAALPSSLVGSRFFGHHLVDDSATMLLAAEFAPAFRAPAAAVETWPHAAAYRKRMGVEAPVLCNARVAEAWLFQDWGMTAHRRTRLERLRQQLRDSPGPRAGHGVFLRRRGAGAARVLANEEELERILERMGFDIVDPSSDSADLVIARCRDARVVVGVEGSGLAHGFLGCAPDATFVVLQHPYQFNNVWKDFTDALGMRYAFLVGEGSRECFRVDPDELKATLDLL
ncbi:MAG: glycosyltransferase family 61 protein [Alphaproteobacteria bacterium]|nr:glycosyltransferase family 61 protein [Alphaproteobacteria bacterium]